MRAMINVLAEAIEWLNANNSTYLFALHNTKTPLPGTGKEQNWEMYIIRTDREGGKRDRMLSFNYTFKTAKEEEIQKEKAAEWMIFELIQYALYHFEQEPKR